MLAVTANAVMVAEKEAATATVAMLAVVDETAAVVSAAKLPMAKSAHPAKAVAVEKDVSKGAKAMQDLHVVSALNAVSAPLARAVAMDELKTVAKHAPMLALKPVPMRHPN